MKFYHYKQLALTTVVTHINKFKKIVNKYIKVYYTFFKQF